MHSSPRITWVIFIFVVVYNIGEMISWHSIILTKTLSSKVLVFTEDFPLMMSSKIYNSINRHFEILPHKERFD